MGLFMRHILPDYMPFFQSDLGIVVANVTYYLGLILFIASLLILGIMVNSLKKKTKKQINLTGSDAISHQKALDFIQALGGVNNIEGVDSCMSRVRINIHDVDRIDQQQIQNLGASGLFMSGNQIQAIFGSESTLISEEIEKNLL